MWRGLERSRAIDIALACGLAAAGVTLHSAVAPVLAMLLASWSVGAYLPRPRAVVTLATFVGGVWLAMGIDLLQGPDHYQGTDFPWLGGLVAPPGVMGITFGARTRSLHEAERRADALERERLAATAEERARIARELHDVVAHAVSVMTVQAGAAEEMLGHDPALALEPVRAVQETGRQALVEMKRLVGMLRAEDVEVGLAPQPSLRDLNRLAAQVREAGLPVELLVEGEPRPLPLGVDLSAYRLVQEGLTNALKHAQAATATVTLAYGERELTIEVSDDGRGGDCGADGSLGHGLAGMRERVGVFGGELVAGPRTAGGFAVRARLPLGAPG